MTTFITRCPTCSQAYKLDETVLNAKDGQVRCGFCNSVFNAKEHLYRSKSSAQTSVAVMERQAEMERQGIASMKALASQLQGFEAVDEPTNLTRVSQVAPTAPTRQEVINAPLAQNEAIPTPSSEESVEQVLHLTPNRENQEPDGDDDDEIQEDKPSRTWLWVLVALIALVGIAAQLLAMYRPLVLEKAPQMEKVYVPLCQYLTCAQPKTDEKEVVIVKPVFSVVNHQLEKLDAQRWGIRVTVKNDTELEQDYPTLLVQLKSAKEDILTRRQILPTVYLDDKTKKVAANAQADIAFAFELKEGEPASLTVEIDPRP